MRHMVAKGDEEVGVEDIIIIIYLFLLLWLLFTSKHEAEGVEASRWSGSREADKKLLLLWEMRIEEAW